MTGGANGSWTKGSGTTYKITVKRDPNDGECFSHFTSVEFDGSDLAVADYTAASGSTVITLKAATLQKQTNGTHTVTIKFDDGSASAILTIKPEPRSPATGDNRHTTLWAWLTMLTALSMGGISVFSKKRWYTPKH